MQRLLKAHSLTALSRRNPRASMGHASSDNHREESERSEVAAAGGATECATDASFIESPSSSWPRTAPFHGANGGSNPPGDALTAWEARAAQIAGLPSRSRGAFSRDLATRFWTKVEQRGPDECWPWIAGKRRGGGYGAITVCGRTVAAAHVAVHLAQGMPLQPGMVVLHKCDNPPCCNPRHLVVDTQKANMLDMVAKGRAKPVRGEAHSRAKLTDAALADLLARARSGERHAALAQEFGISVGYVNTLLRGERRRSA